jgi:hypothetical protein
VWDGDASGDEVDANRRFTKANTALSVGEVITLDLPVSDGIRVDVTTSGDFIFIHGNY